MTEAQATDLLAILVNMNNGLFIFMFVWLVFKILQWKN